MKRVERCPRCGLQTTPRIYIVAPALGLRVCPLCGGSMGYVRLAGGPALPRREGEGP
jgi:uncharacterized protein (UPF0212 family)